MPETVNNSQSIAREDKDVSHCKQEKFDRIIDTPEGKVRLRLAPQSTRRLWCRQIDARQDPHSSLRHHRVALSNRLLWILSRFALEKDVRDGKQRGSESETVQPVREHFAAREISILPESIKQRVVRPVVVPNVV